LGRTRLAKEGKRMSEKCPNCKTFNLIIWGIDKLCAHCQAYYLPTQAQPQIVTILTKEQFQTKLNEWKKHFQTLVQSETERHEKEIEKLNKILESLENAIITEKWKK